jgi:hypothetical protein
LKQVPGTTQGNADLFAFSRGTRICSYWQAPENLKMVALPAMRATADRVSPICSAMWSTIALNGVKLLCAQAVTEELSSGPFQSDFTGSRFLFQLFQPSLPDSDRIA